MDLKQLVVAAAVIVFALIALFRVCFPEKPVEAAPKKAAATAVAEPTAAPSTAPASAPGAVAKSSPAAAGALAEIAKCIAETKLPAVAADAPPSSLVGLGECTAEPVGSLSKFMTHKFGGGLMAMGMAKMFSPPVEKTPLRLLSLDGTTVVENQFMLIPECKLGAFEYVVQHRAKTWMPEGGAKKSPMDTPVEDISPFTKKPSKSAWTWELGGLTEVVEEDGKLFVSREYASGDKLVGISTFDGKICFARVSTRCKMLTEFPAGREPPEGTQFPQEMKEAAEREAAQAK